MQTNNRDRIYLLDLSLQELENLIFDIGLEPYRTRQIFKGVYHHLIPDFSTLSTLRKSLRQELDEKTVLRKLTLKDRIISAEDNTNKFLWKAKDEKYIESVIIQEGKRITYCISTQIGCSLGCKFCATAKMGLLRNLSSGEIVEQVIQMNLIAQTRPTNIVFMGMGEPLLNTINVLKAAYIMSDSEGMTIARKRIILSTSGIAPAIRKLAESDFPFSLAVSLNAADNQKRQSFMPIAKKFPLKELLDSLTYFFSKKKSRITFEYVLIAGLNDSRKDAENLIKISKKVPSKINLIPCNSQDPTFQPPPSDHINWFASYLRDHYCTVTVRSRKGYDIEAACGQLYAKHIESKNS